MRRRRTASKNMELGRTLKYIQIIPFIFGVIGSLLIIKIMLRPAFRKMPRHLTCIALATIDLLFLIYSLFTDLFEIVTGASPVVTSGIILCKVHLPLLGFFNHLDAWLLITLTLDRLLAVARPLQVNQIVTTFRTKMLLIVLIVFFFSWDAENIVRLNLFKTEVPGTNQTYVLCQSTGYYGGIPPQLFKMKDVIGVLLRGVVPISLIVPANVIIVIKIFRQKRARATMTGSMSQNNNEISKTIWMVVSASVAYVILVTPITVYVSTVIIVRQDLNFHTDPMYLVLQMINRINPSLNGYLYFMCSSLFKAEVKKWLSSARANSDTFTSPSRTSNVLGTQVSVCLSTAQQLALQPTDNSKALQPTAGT